MECESEDIFEDRFDDESFHDAPLSEEESEFDENDLRSLDDYGKAGDMRPCSELKGDISERGIDRFSKQSDPYYPTTLSTIAEELDDISRNDENRPPQFSRSPDFYEGIRNEFSFGGISESNASRRGFNSTEFKHEGNLLELMERAELSYNKKTGGGNIIENDQRFNQTHFNKENSWEPSIHNSPPPLPNTFYSSPKRSILGPVQTNLETPRRLQNVTTVLPICPTTSPFISRNNSLVASKILKPGCLQQALENEPTKKADAFGSSDGPQQKNLDQFNKKKPNLHVSHEIRKTPTRDNNKPLFTVSDSFTDSIMESHFASTPNSVYNGDRPSKQLLRNSLTEKFIGLSAVETSALANVDSSSVDAFSALRLVSGKAKTLPLQESISESLSESTVDPSLVDKIIKEMDVGAPPQKLIEALERARKMRPKFMNSIVSNNPSGKPCYSSLPLRSNQATKQVNIFVPKKNKVSPIKHELSLKSACLNAEEPQESCKVKQYTCPVKHSGYSHSNSISREEPCSTNSKLVIQQGSKVSCTDSRSESFISRPESGILSRPQSAITRDVNGGRFSSMSTSIEKRSPLHIPQQDVAFGFIAIGDTSLATLRMSNRLETPLRISISLRNTQTAFMILDSNIHVLDPGCELIIRVQFSPTKPARYNTSISVKVLNGLGKSYTVQVHGSGGIASIRIPYSDELYPSRSGYFILNTSSERTLRFPLENKGEREAFVHIRMLTPDGAPISDVEISPSDSLVIKRGTKMNVTIRLNTLFCFSYPSDWRSSTASLASTRSGQSTGSTATVVGKNLKIEIYWGEEIIRQRLKCLEHKRGKTFLIEGISFSKPFDGEQENFCCPDNYPVSSSDYRLFETLLRTHIICVLSSRHSVRKSLMSDMSMSQSLQPDATFRDRTTLGNTVVPDVTLF